MREHEAKNTTGYMTLPINRRLTLDRRTAALRAGKRGLRVEEVQDIWLPMIERVVLLPTNWVVNSGVLVGIR